MNVDFKNTDSYRKALALFKEAHYERYNFTLNDKKIGKGVTAGELMGFNLAYEVLIENTEENLMEKTSKCTISRNK